MGKTPALNTRQPQNAEKRKIEFSAAILHLDDVPTAMALTGVKIIEPVILLFFAFSGYRTGIGYRNDASAHKPQRASNLYAPLQTPQKAGSLLLNSVPAFYTTYRLANPLPFQPFPQAQAS